MLNCDNHRDTKNYAERDTSGTMGMVITGQCVCCNRYDSIQACMNLNSYVLNRIPWPFVATHGTP